ncbi:TPA: restriction endonuclease subunit S [Vibrio cholerae]|nr:restriction endonuclease subunit S [Vibrio cholerae]EGR5455980.1 restriction endonuclease subunit S [Vibrio cholerae]EGR5463323.1 restriction endonuclease subunit S [Vibrio cholerae]GHW71375.1 restriction endonuclease subunit S [Vibrio cholerae]HEQ3486535.1 restriction endonuclease subunit S [Vibrio cholerae]
MNLRSTDSMSVEALQSKGSSFKNTEVGRVPTDWEVVCLREVANFGGGTTPPRKNFEKFYASGTHPWVKTLDLNNGYISSTEENVTEAAFSETSLKMHPIGTVLVAMYGGFNQIGRTGLIKVSAAINQALVAVITKKERLVPTYLLYYLNYKVDYWKTVASSSRKDPNITSNDVKNFILPLPSVIEQTAIANALSDVDALIQELEKLIAKKQAIKTATMQQLLTGRTRLPQFAHHPDGRKKGYKPSELGEIPEDWVIRCLGDICYLKSGLGITATELDEHGEYPCYGGNGLRGYTNRFTHEGEYVLVGRQGALCGNVQHVLGCFFASEHALVATPLGGVNSKWLSIYLERMNLNQYSESSAQPGLSAEKLKVLKLITPPAEEQQAVAEVLYEMEDEIRGIEQRLHKTRQIKQGMMQELLIGKTRLIQRSETI